MKRAAIILLGAGGGLLVMFLILFIVIRGARSGLVERVRNRFAPPVPAVEDPHGHVFEDDGSAIMEKYWDGFKMLIDTEEGCLRMSPPACSCPPPFPAGGAHPKLRLTENADPLNGRTNAPSFRIHLSEVAYGRDLRLSFL